MENNIGELTKFLRGAIITMLYNSVIGMHRGGAMIGMGVRDNSTVTAILEAGKNFSHTDMRRRRSGGSQRRHR